MVVSVVVMLISEAEVATKTCGQKERVYDHYVYEDDKLINIKGQGYSNRLSLRVWTCCYVIVGKKLLIVSIVFYFLLDYKRRACFLNKKFLMFVKHFCNTECFTIKNILKVNLQFTQVFTGQNKKIILVLFVFRSVVSFLLSKKKYKYFQL